MRCDSLVIVAIIAAVPTVTWGAQSVKLAITSQDSDSVTWVDVASQRTSAGQVRVVDYIVFSQDRTESLDGSAQSQKFTYTATGSDLVLNCSSRHYSLENAYFYNRLGNVVKVYEGLVVTPTLIAPQTAVEAVYNHFCGNGTLYTIEEIPDDTTPMTYMIDVSRKVFEKQIKGPHSH
jgi:hypothetical protein